MCAISGIHLGLGGIRLGQLRQALDADLSDLWTKLSELWFGHLDC